MSKLSREDELNLFQKWNQTGHKKYFQELYRSYKPLLAQAGKKASYGSNLPKSVFELEAANEFYRSLKEFNPKKAKMQTYVFGNVQNKLKRLNTKYKDLSRIPERTSGGYFDVGRLKNAEEMLRDELGREPSATEISENTGMTVREVTRLREESGVKNLSLNETLNEVALKDDYYDPSLEAVYYDMNPEEQVVFDRITGLHGQAPILKHTDSVDFNRLSSVTGLSTRRVTEVRKRIAKQIRKAEL